MNNNIRYVRFETNQGTGYGCFDINWKRENGKLVCQVGAAFCNPKDRFSKDMARKIAKGRSEVRSIAAVVDSIEQKFITDNDFNNILNCVFYQDDNSIIPNWARRAFDRGFYSLTLRSQDNQFDLLKSLFSNVENLISEPEITEIIAKQK